MNIYDQICVWFIARRALKGFVLYFSGYIEASDATRERQRELSVN